MKTTAAPQKSKSRGQIVKRKQELEKAEDAAEVSSDGRDKSSKTDVAKDSTVKKSSKVSPAVPAVKKVSIKAAKAAWGSIFGGARGKK